MVKFSREYEASIIPEWKGAFVDYKCLKKLIKKIKVARRDEDDSSTASDADADALVTAAGGAGAAAEGFSVRALAARFAPRVQATPEDEENSDSSGELVRLAAKHEREFLERADEELEKVNGLYAALEAELLGRGAVLTDQLRILTDVKRILTDVKRILADRRDSSNALWTDSWLRQI